MRQRARTIVIVGAGFSGTAVAVNLLRGRQIERSQALRIVLLDRAEFARGTAYADREYPYLLNVPAGRMSATACDPGEFLDFAQRRLPHATAEDFLPRTLYGQYLAALLRAAEKSAPHGVSLETLHGEATGIERAVDSAGVRVDLAGATPLVADQVVLALGNPPPARLPGTERLVGSPHYLEDPWSAPLEIRAGESVLMLGTGLTMADVAVAAAERTAGRVLIHALSRHGLMPAVQSAFRPAPAAREATGPLDRAPQSLRALVHTLRLQCNQVEREGGDWREAISRVRMRAPALWQDLPPAERARFLRHARSFWDIHRHRLPEETFARLERLRAARSLHIHAGRLLGLALARDRVRATWRARGTQQIAQVRIDRVINCTGPDCDPGRTRSALLRSLLAGGIAVGDPLGLGLRTAAHGALIDRCGRAACDLYYIGPMLRADYWEATAVPELREHAERLAHHLLSLRERLSVTDRRAV